MFDKYCDDAVSEHIKKLNKNNSIQENNEKDIAYENHKNKMMLVNEDFLFTIKKELLKSNKYCQELKFIGDVLTQIDDTNINDNYNNENTNKVQDERDMKYMKAQLVNKVQYFDVAQILHERTTGQKIITIYKKNNFGSKTKLPMNDKKVEGIIFPLLFQNSELGHDLENDTKEIPYGKRLSNLLLMPELKSKDGDGNNGPDFLTVRFPDQYDENIQDDQVQRELRINRFQLLARVSQTFMVNMVSRQIDKNLNFISRNQERLLMGQKRYNNNINKYYKTKYIYRYIL